ncbi:Na+/H+ antiporter [Sinirhodobacter populi]|uniref:Na+/H+ antiporter n=1 Tax=Paenirhodobacter populi TaxID=2306993 RepID=A0A443KNG8_9RHOB|nr:Na+/H+ antiporter [Sinirhodobacter populi]RWR34435.1 Na+/H+ antiporter [Sinirhodobacter populi]
MAELSVVLILLFVVVVSGGLSRMLPKTIPLPLVQIALGAGVAAIADLGVSLEPELFFLLFLPPLLFLDGWRIQKEGLFRDIGTILNLALGLVVFTVLGIGLLINWLIPAISLPLAFALAAILSPTDPVAVSAISRRVNVPKRLMHILEGESLLNDASGLVCMRFAVAAAMTGAFSLSSAALTFLWLALAGVAAGVAVCWLVTFTKGLVTARYGEDAGSQILVSLLIPFAAYLVAEKIGASGILAAVSAGLTMSYSEISGKALATTRIRRNAVWDTVQFSLNGVMFVILGEQLPKIVSNAVVVVQETGHHDPIWMLAYVVVINVALAVLRFVWVWVSYRLVLLRQHRQEKTDWKLIAATSVAGARGAITLAAVLSLPLTMTDGSLLPARDLLIFIAAGVIIVSLIMASIILPLLLRNVAMPPEPLLLQQQDRVRQAAAEAAITAVGKAVHALPVGQEDKDLYAHAATRIIDMYRERIAGYSSKEAADMARYKRAQEAERQLWLVAMRAERETIYDASRRNRLPDDVARDMVREVDLIEERLGSA